MTIQLLELGGYGEIGRNSTAIKIDDEVIIIDMGLHMQKYVEITEDEEAQLLSAHELSRKGVIPDPEMLSEWKPKVKAILTTHAHLDHIGAMPFIANKFNAAIICTPFTKAVLERILSDDNRKLRNEIIALRQNKTFKLSKNISIEFIAVTHSTPQTAIIAIHTKYGAIVYSNDFKLDPKPVIGEKTNIKRLKELGKQGIFLYIADSLYADIAMKTPAESVVQELLEDTFSSLKGSGLIVVTTFASHIARLKGILNLGSRIGRRIIIMGRSLEKYITAAKATGLIKIPKNVEILKYKRQINKKLRKINKDNKERYLLITTGHQAEPKSVLVAMANDSLSFRFENDDAVIFSSKTIPVEFNILNRKKLENSLKSKGVRIFTDIHVSGHASREDLREMISILKPKYLVPSHSTFDKAQQFAELAKTIGYEINKNIFIINNGLLIDFPNEESIGKL